MSDRITLLLVGNCGHMEMVFSALEKRPETFAIGVIGGFSANDSDFLQQKCETLGYLPRIFTSIDEGIKHLSPDIVCIDGPFNLHASMCSKALGSGAHVFVEKPCALTLDELAELRQTWELSGKRLSTMMNLRYRPAFWTAKEKIDDGAIGHIRLLHAQKSYKLGKRPEAYKSRETFGGMIPWVGIHAIDWVHWLSGQKVSLVHAAHSSKSNRDHGDLESTAAIHLAMENEVMATIICDYLRPDSLHGHSDDRIRIVGDRGILEIRKGELLINDQPQPLSTPPDLFSNFLDATLGKDMPIPTEEEIFHTTKVALKAREAADLLRNSG